MVVRTYPNRELPGSTEALRRPKSQGRIAAIQEGFSYTTGSFGARVLNQSDAADDGPRLSRDAVLQFQQQNGLDFGAIPENGYTQAQLDLMGEHQLAKRRRQRIMQESGLGGVENFIWGVVGGLPDPVNLLFLPAGLAGSAVKTLGSRAAVGALEGVAVAGVYEGMRLPASKYLKEDYSFAEAGLNFVLSAGLGGAIGGLLGRKAKPNLKEIDNLMPELAPQDRQQIGQIAIAQVLDGRPVNVTPAMARAARRRAADDLLDADQARALNDIADEMDNKQARATKVPPTSRIGYESSRVAFKEMEGAGFVERNADPYMTPEFLDSLDMKSMFPDAPVQPGINLGLNGPATGRFTKEWLDGIDLSPFQTAPNGAETVAPTAKPTDQPGAMTKEAQELLDVDEGSIDELLNSLDDEAREAFEESMDEINAYVKDTEGFTKAVEAAVTCGSRLGLG